MSRHFQACEQANFEQAVESLEFSRMHLEKILARIQAVTNLNSQGAKFLDIGSAQGQVLIAAARLGFHAEGVEPWLPAHAVAQQIANQQSLTIKMHHCRAEEIDLPPASFDFVHANSVLEHVENLPKVLQNIFRILKPGGVFWFCSTNSLCPHQIEISKFPLFSWYPNALKKRIMLWAKKKHPTLIGNTQTPAMHWFTPGKTRKLLREAGFDKIFDRWDIRLTSEGGNMHKVALKIIRSTALTKLLADVFVPHCSYLAIKPVSTEK